MKVAEEKTKTKIKTLLTTIIFILFNINMGKWVLVQPNSPPGGSVPQETVQFEESQRSHRFRSAPGRDSMQC